MRRPAALIFAASFLFTLSSLLTQAQTSQTDPPSPEKPAETEKAQSSEKAQSPTANQGSAEEQQKASDQESTPEKSTPTEKLQSEKAQGSAAKSESAQKQENPFDKFQQFSATVSGGPLRFDNMPIYRLGNKIRTDWNYEHEIRVSDLGQRKSWFIRHWPDKPEKCGPGDKMEIGSYPFFAYPDSDKELRVEHLPSAVPAEKETYDGHPSTIEHYTVTRISDGVIIAKIKIWEAADLKGFPVRMEIDPPLMGKVFNLYYSNVSLGRPDPKLFEVPAKCLKENAVLEATPSPKSKSSKAAGSPKSDESSAPPQ